LTRIAVILHERLGTWARQLRPRLYDLPIRWFETRSIADLDQVLAGMASPVVLIDLGSRPAAGLLGLRAILQRASDARVLVLDPEVHPEAAGLARELGATHVITGFVPPPVVASLLRRWVKLAQRGIERGGWSRAQTPDPETEPWSWLAPYLAGPASARIPQKDPR
jgi:DNA-binding NarL/FixJ family response regulator